MADAGLHGNVAYINQKPVVGLRTCLWGDGASGDKVGVDGLVRELKTMTKDPSDVGSYSIVVNEMGNSWDSILNASKALAEDGGKHARLPLLGACCRCSVRVSSPALQRQAAVASAAVCLTRAGQPYCCSNTWRQLLGPVLLTIDAAQALTWCCLRS